MSNNQTLEEQLAIINNNVYSIKDIKNPFEEVQLIAIKNILLALEYIENPTEKVQIEAVRIDGYAIAYIENPSLEVQIEAIKQDSLTIKYIKHPSIEVQNMSLNENLEAIKYIKNYKDSSVIRESWGTYGGKLILFKFKDIKYVNAGCFITDKYEEFKTKLKEQQENYSEDFTDIEDTQLALKEVKEYLSK